MSWTVASELTAQCDTSDRFWMSPMVPTVTACTSKSHWICPVFLERSNVQLRSARYQSNSSCRPRNALRRQAPLGAPCIFPLVGTNLGSAVVVSTIRLWYDAAVAVALMAVAALVCGLIAAVVTGGSSPNLLVGTIAFLGTGGIMFVRIRRTLRATTQ